MKNKISKQMMRPFFKRRTFIFLLCITVFAACTEKKDNTGKISNQKIDVKKAPPFSADSAYLFIEKQVNFGPRVPNSVAHTATKDFIINTLQRLGANVELQSFQEKSFDGKTLQLTNIIASFNPKASKRVLLAAHWDTRPMADQDKNDPDKPILGANDGGSGVGILLEIARVMHTHQTPNIGIDMIFFDGEDYGEPSNNMLNPEKIFWCLGSQYWSKNKHKSNYSAYYGILLDMVGAKNATFYQEGASRQYAPSVVKKVWNAAQHKGHQNFFVNKNSPAITDDHIFVNQYAKIPMIDIIEYYPSNQDTYFAPYWHTHKDNMDIIDKKTLLAVGETVLHVIYNE